MLDQSFSAENFRTILDLENRKGIFLEGLFFSNVKQANDEIKQCNQDIKTKRRSKATTSDDLKKLYEERKELKAKKDDLLNSELQKISEKVRASNFRIELERKVIADAKPFYLMKDSPECYFAMKQIQRNVSRLFGVKQANRFEIVSQVKTLLNDRFPKYVLKTDIDDFYESIPHKNLLAKINGNNLLSPFSRKILRQILSQYKKLSNSDKGIPRGIGVSAYLAELYMRDVDRKILSLEHVRYYARYVDDIIIIFTPSSLKQNRNYLKEVKNIIEVDFGLKLNDGPLDNKTKMFDLSDSSQSCELEYLGYKIFFESGIVKTRLTDKKINKYKNRVDLAFNNFFHLSKVRQKEARNLLIKRVRFITGNTQLKNNKNNVLVGIYYSNRQLTEQDDLRSLDDYLRNKINNIGSVRLQNRLKRYRFVDGFNTKRFSPFKTHELQKIMKIWK